MWAGRGQSVCMDDGGRWVLGEHVPGWLSIDDTVGAPDSPPNLLIHAEAYAALRSLGDTLGDERVRLCYIDPPYNTGQGFETYDDRAAHGVWLSCLEERVILARKLLHANGYFVAHVNIVEHAYLKVLLDEIFGRERLLSQISWQRAPDRTVLGQGGALVSDQVEYLLVYANDRVDPDWPRPKKQSALSAKTLQSYARVLQPSADAKLINEFSDHGGSPVRVYQHEAFTMRTLPASALRAAANQVDDKIISVFNNMARLTNQQPESTFQQEILSRLPERDVLYRAEYTQTRGKHKGPRKRHYMNNQVVLWLRDVAKIEQNRLVRVADLNNFWPADEIPATGIANEGGVVLRRGKKPERLMARVIEAFSRPGDWILDFFAGSGTTGAVAEMLGRRWILVEAGSSAHKLCKPRLARAVGKTGGGFAVATVSPHIHSPAEK